MLGSKKESTRRSFLGFAAAGLASASVSHASNLGAQTPPGGATASSKQMFYDVRSYGAKGDGITVDTPAINRAIESVASAGGGTVYFPSGNYLCYTIHLKSNVA
ncbi:MAG TPA: glycosyl hydrolase family 28-related protein, partial [Terriglobales bacterium]|nr:glycosyl hydrolase family 28-related protein [Terriglobales bacterium]